VMGNSRACVLSNGESGYEIYERAQSACICKSHLKNLSVARVRKGEGGSDAGTLGSRVQGATKLIL